MTVQIKPAPALKLIQSLVLMPHPAPAYYNCGPLLERLYEITGCTNDAQLSQILRVAPPQISKLRSHRLSLTPAMMLRIWDCVGLDLGEQRALCGIPAPDFGPVEVGPRGARTPSTRL